MRGHRGPSLPTPVCGTLSSERSGATRGCCCCWNQNSSCLFSQMPFQQSTERRVGHVRLEVRTALYLVRGGGRCTGRGAWLLVLLVLLALVLLLSSLVSPICRNSIGPFKFFHFLANQRTPIFINFKHCCRDLIGLPGTFRQLIAPHHARSGRHSTLRLVVSGPTAIPVALTQVLPHTSTAVLIITARFCATIKILSQRSLSRRTRVFLKQSLRMGQLLSRLSSILSRLKVSSC